MLKPTAPRNIFTYDKLFHQLEEIVQNFSVTYGKHFRRLPKVCQLVLFAQDLLLFAQLAESFAEVYCSPSNSHGKFGFNIRLRRAWWP